MFWDLSLGVRRALHQVVSELRSVLWTKEEDKISKEEGSQDLPSRMTNAELVVLVKK